MSKLVRFPRQGAGDFFHVLNERVSQFFEENQLSRTGDYRLYLKTFVMYALFLGPLVLVMTLPMPGWAVLIAYAVMGLGVSGIGLCVMHDANHGSFARSKFMNKLFGYSMNAIGGSSFTWHIQHNVLHHTFTNIYSLDEDIHDKPFIRLSPSGIWKKYHRFQHIYAFFLYSLATISWLGFKDFKQLREYNRTGATREYGFNPTKETIIMIVSKVLFVAFVLVLPIVFGAPLWAVLTGFVLMHLISGLYITTVFQLAHVVEDTQDFSAPTSGRMENTWAIHQLATTSNFACDNPFLTWMVGGLNHQVEHHLFPGISHVHYPRISKIVRQTAREFNVPYYEHKRLYQAIRSHARQLKALGHPETQPFLQEAV
jgi:linoleoyl-CoA desaturase